MATLADNALTTLEDVKDALGIAATDTTRDNYLTRLINYASSWVETITGRKLALATYTQRYPGTGTQTMALLQWPIVSVEYVRDTDTGTDFPATSFDATQDADIGLLYKDDGWPLRGYAGGLSEDVRALRRYIEVNYTAGYVLPKDATPNNPATLPAALSGIVEEIVMQEYATVQNGAQGLAAFQISDVTWTFDKEPRASWLDTLARYTRL